MPLFFTLGENSEMIRLCLLLCAVLLIAPQAWAQPAGCEYPENGAYECKSGELVLETGFFKNGMKNGEFKRYTFGGKLLVLENYVDDKRQGEAKTFGENGQVKFLRKYENDVKISDEAFWEDGSHKYKRMMDANGRQGTHYTYWENGNPREMDEWKDDKLLKSSRYDEMGRIYISEEVNDDGTSYMWKYYKENGQVSEEGPIGPRGYEDGHWKVYDEAGTLRMEGNYKSGKRTGEWKAYDEKGELVQTKIFE